MHLAKLLSAAAFGAIVFITPAHATRTLTNGGPGGTTFSLACGEGQFLVGVEGNALRQIDQIRPLCADFDRQQQTLGSAAPRHQPVGSSTGGRFSRAVCPVNTMVRSVRFVARRDVNGDAQYIRGLELTCARSTNLNAAHVVRFNYFPTLEGIGQEAGQSGPDPVFETPCLPGEAATGLIGRAGRYVTQLGLDCAAPPAFDAGRAAMSTQSNIPVAPPRPRPDYVNRSIVIRP